MIKFNFKKIIPSAKRLGGILKNKRQAQKISLLEASQSTGVNQVYLKALEEGEYKALPGEIYGRNFLGAYLDFLKIEKSVFLKLYQEEYQAWSREQPRSEEKLEQKFKPRPHPTSFFLPPQFFKILVIVILALVCAGYLGYKINNIITPPFLEITFPPQNYETEELKIVVEGQTAKEVKITINNEVIYSDQAGYFKKNIDLQKGLNTIKISVAKKHGRERVVERYVLVR